MANDRRPAEEQDDDVRVIRETRGVVSALKDDVLFVLLVLGALILVSTQIPNFVEAYLSGPPRLALQKTCDCQKANRPEAAPDENHQ